MVTLTISCVSNHSAVVRGFPLSIEVPDNATVADVKASIAAKKPKVSYSACITCAVQYRVILALRMRGAFSCHHVTDHES
jgi:hypothetical protein